MLMIYVLLSIGMGDVLDGNASEALSRVLINFLQVIAIFATFPLAWPEFIRSMFEMQGVVSTMSSFLLNPECELTMSVLEIFYFKMIVWAFMPIFVGLITYVSWRVWSCVMRKDWRKEEPSEPPTLYEEEEDTSDSDTDSAPTSGRGRSVSQRSNWSDLSKWEKEIERKKVTKKYTSIRTTNNKVYDGWMRVPCTEEQETYQDAPKYYFFNTVTGVTQWEVPAAWEDEMKNELQLSLVREQKISSSSSFQQQQGSLHLVQQRKRSPLTQRKPTPKDHFVVCFVILMHLIYPTACQNTFRLLACTEVGEEWYLQADLEQVCWEGSHGMMIALVCLPQILLYVIGFPLASGLMLFKNRHRLHDARTKYRWGKSLHFASFLFPF